MKYRFPKVTAPLLLIALTAAAAPVAESTLPNENLRYSINWPTGVSLGEAQLSASSTAANLHFAFDLYAEAPAFTVNDRFRSDASTSFCSSNFDKSTSHGSKKVNDKEKFDAATGTVTRGSGAGQSEMSASTCSKDALTFLYFLRHELSEGRLPQEETIYFGAPYQVRLSSAGTEDVKVGNASIEADRVNAEVSGPSSSIGFEMVFLKDPPRTLALVRVPLALGKFSMELEK
jgi:Protein of unknown function (DUF3108)